MHLVSGIQDLECAVKSQAVQAAWGAESSQRAVLQWTRARLHPGEGCHTEGEAYAPPLQEASRRCMP